MTGSALYTYDRRVDGRTQDRLRDSESESQESEEGRAHDDVDRPAVLC